MTGAAALLTATDVLGLLDRTGRRLHRHLGQHFVVDPNTIRRIVDLAALSPDDHVLEIGPGFGTLTLALLDAVGTVTAVEIDPEIAAVLVDVVTQRSGPRADRLRLHVADAAAGGLGALADGAGVVVSNLPYGPATTIILDLLADAPGIGRMVVMVQREVAQRLSASPGTSAWGLPSVVLAMSATARIVGAVPPSVFLPVPRVESALLEVVRRPDPLDPVERRIVGALARSAFEQRRKMLRSSLRASVGEAAFASAGVPPTSRPEELDLDSWRALARTVASA